MANTTENYGLAKPLQSDFYDVEVQNGNMDKIDAGMKANADGIKDLRDGQKNKADLVDGKVPADQLPLMDYIPTSEKGQSGGVATLGQDGKVPAGQLPKMDYDPSGSAAAVQKALTAHTGNKNNPHAVTAEQVGALASSGGAMSGAISMSGHKIANLASPADPTDAANKQYVDEQVGSSRVVMGTYIGDGAPSQTIQLGFTPKAVLVCQNGILSRGLQSHYAEGLALDGYPAAENNSNAVSVVEGGFQVFDGTKANYNGRTNVASKKYYYLTWK